MQKHKSGLLDASGQDESLPRVSEVDCLGGRLRRTRWATENIDFSYLEGNFAEGGLIEEMQPAGGITLIFALKGSIRFQFQKPQHEISCTDQTHQALCLGGQACAIVSDELSLETLLIHIATDLFQAYARKCPGYWPNFATQWAQAQPFALFSTSTYHDIHLQTCLQQILHCHLPAAHRGLYYEAKVMELMALQAACWEQAQQKKPIHSKTEYDRERILFAKEYLLKNMAMPPTLAKLATVSGINEFKLKNGFKEMFGNSVFVYLAEARLALAQRMLTEGSKTATEIAFELGYSSLQHFSSRFKERFGVTPKQLRRP